VRLAAVLIDFFFFGILLFVTGAIVVVTNTWILGDPSPNDFNGWLALLGPFVVRDQQSTGYYAGPKNNQRGEDHFPGVHNVSST
jgi:hypothetical protein